MFRVGIVFLCVVASVSACSDFVFAIDTEADDTQAALPRRRDLAIKAVESLELGTTPHRAALVVYGRRHLKPSIPIHFDDSLNSDAFITKLRSEVDGPRFLNASDNIVATSLGTSDAVDIITRQVVPRRRMGAPVIVIFFTDGRIRPNETTKLDVVTEKLAKKHYVHVFAVNSEKTLNPERQAMFESLTNSETSAIITTKNGQNNVESDLRAALKPFITCEQVTKSRVLRRKPNTMSRASVATTSTTVGPTTKARVFAGNRARSVGFSVTPFRTRPTTTIRTTTQRAFTGKPGCLVDLVFLLDFSGGAVDKREKYVKLAADIIRSLPLGEFHYQIAFVRYSGPRRTDSVFHFKKHADAETAITEMFETPSMGGTTRTGAAMLDANREFDAKYGGRTKANKVMLVMTDGYSQDDPVDASSKLNHERVKVLAVAFDDSNLPPDVEQLKAIATEPKNVFLERDFTKLKQQFVLPNNCRS